MAHLLSKSKYIRGLQCLRALYFDVHHPKWAYYPPETIARFKLGRDFEKEFKSTFPNGIDISARLHSRMASYPALTAQLLSQPGEVVLFEAGFLYNDVLVLADVVHKKVDGTVIIYEVKNSDHVSDTFRNDVSIQHYVITHSLPNIIPSDLFCTQLTLSNFYLLYHDENGQFLREDLMEYAKTKEETIVRNVALFKETILAPTAPEIEQSSHCDEPYTCPYKRSCKWKSPTTKAL